MGSLRFCPDCNNLMFPQESREKRKLIFTCKSCGGEEIADGRDLQSNTVYQYRLKKTAATKLDSVKVDVVHDPTLPRTNNESIKVCPRCEHYQAVFFQADSGRDSDMALVFVCCNSNCHHKWLMHSEKGESAN